MLNNELQSTKEINQNYCIISKIALIMPETPQYEFDMKMATKFVLTKCPLTANFIDNL